MKDDVKKCVHKPVFINRNIKKLIHGPIKLTVKYTICFGSDMIDLLLGRRDKLTAPAKFRVRVGCFLNFISSNNYRSVGREFFQYLRDFCALKLNDNILDVGCGCGQIAAQLTKYLHPDGRYEGLDIDRAAIEWCREQICSQYPNFNFVLTDVFNNHFHPKGKIKASDYKFPYEKESFDVVLLKFVFNHMLRHDVENYLSETARVLKKNGRCFITYYLLNPESLDLIDAKLSTLDFKYEAEGCYVLDKSMPEYTVGYDEMFIRQLYTRHGLNIVEPIHYGYWCGRKKFLTFQDIILAVKR